MCDRSGSDQDTYFVDSRGTDIWRSGTSTTEEIHAEERSTNGAAEVLLTAWVMEIDKHVPGPAWNLKYNLKKTVEEAPNLVTFKVGRCDKKSMQTPVSAFLHNVDDASDRSVRLAFLHVTAANRSSYEFRGNPAFIEHVVDGQSGEWFLPGDGRLDPDEYRVALSYGKPPYDPYQVTRNRKRYLWEKNATIPVGTLRVPACGGMIPTSEVPSAESKPKARIKQAGKRTVLLTMTPRAVAKQTLFKVRVKKPGAARAFVQTYKVAPGKVAKRKIRVPARAKVAVRSKVPDQYGVRQYKLKWKVIARRTMK